MAISGTTSYSDTELTLITDALGMLSVLGESETPSTNAITRANRVLNRLVKAWQSMGLNLWTKTQGTIFLQNNIQLYQLNASTGVVAAGGIVTETQTNGIIGSGSTTLTVLSTAGMLSTNYITIEQSDGTVLNTTINTVVNTTSLTINNPLTAATNGSSRVSVYTVLLDRPLEITQVMYRNASNYERELRSDNPDDWFRIVNKNVNGYPVEFYYDPQEGTGNFYVWYLPSDSTGVLRIEYIRVIDDFDATGNTPDFPTEWNMALTSNLALALAPFYGKGDDIVKWLGPIAKADLEDLKTWDNEKNNFRISLDQDGDRNG